MITGKLWIWQNNLLAIAKEKLSFVCSLKKKTPAEKPGFFIVKTEVK
jgi:hypothetical protein